MTLDANLASAADVTSEAPSAVRWRFSSGCPLGLLRPVAGTRRFMRSQYGGAVSATLPARPDPRRVCGVVAVAAPPSSGFSVRCYFLHLPGRSRRQYPGGNGLVPRVEALPNPSAAFNLDGSHGHRVGFRVMESVKSRQLHSVHDVLRLKRWSAGKPPDDLAAASSSPECFSVTSLRSMDVVQLALGYQPAATVVRVRRFAPVRDREAPFHGARRNAL